jgi:hypothetical protein
MADKPEGFRTSRPQQETQGANPLKGTLGVRKGVTPRQRFEATKQALFPEFYKAEIHSQLPEDRYGHRGRIPSTEEYSLRNQRRVRLDVRISLNAGKAGG